MEVSTPVLAGQILGCMPCHACTCGKGPLWHLHAPCDLLGVGLHKVRTDGVQYQLLQWVACRCIQSCVIQ